IKRDGQMEAFESVGATVLANACGPCIGQWKRDDIQKGERNSIITSFNRNFRARNDSNPETFAFIASPEIVLAYGLAGTLDFDPLNDEIVQGDKRFKLPAPSKADDLPPSGFVRAVGGYAAPAEDGSKVEVRVDPNSERLQLLAP